MQNTEEIWRLVDVNQDDFIALSDRVWDMPELCYAEFRSCAEHTAMLEAKAFASPATSPASPPRSMGEAGEAGPVIAILGEYDALPGLSQEAGIAEQKPLPGPGFGHGCGHNLLGVRLHARRRRGEGLPGSQRHPRKSPLLRLPGRGRRRRQGVHGSRRSLRRCRCRDLLASSSFSGVNPAASLANTRIDFPFMAERRMPPRRRISDAARWTRWS